MGSAEWVFESQHGSVPHARRLIGQTLDHLPDESLGVVLLLATEVMTNAVLHGAGSVGLRLGWDGKRVRVEVTDLSPDVPVARALDREALDGRGLLLVDSLSTGWGVLPVERGLGKTVWFTVSA